MHNEILTREQIEILPFVGRFSRNFGLVGGTAIALHIGHRRSIDFDLFSLKKFNNYNIQKKILQTNKKFKTLVNREGEFTFLFNEVKITFFQYPYPINYSKRFDDIIRVPDLLTLAAMKAFALGQRNKWKDYVDLYFIIKNHYSIKDVIKKTKLLFNDAFNDRLFRNQLAYFKDINYSEQVIFMPGFETDKKTIEKKLIEYSLE